MNLKKIIQNKVVIILCMFVFSIVIVSFNKKLDNIEILNDIFLITYMLTMLGFSLTVSAILYSFIEKVNSKIKCNDYDLNKSNTIKKLLKSLLKELKDDTLLIFILLLNLILISLFKDINFPNLHLYGYKSNIIYIIKIMSLFLSSYSMLDITLTVFKILSINEN